MCELVPLATAAAWINLPLCRFLETQQALSSARQTETRLCFGLGEVQSVISFCEMLDSSSASAKDVVLSFGTHKGKPIKQVDDGYLRWMHASLGSSQWRKLAHQVLQERKQQAQGRKRVLLDELKMCSKTRNLQRGKEIHAEAMGNVDIYLATALIDMYAKCGSMSEARKVFDGVRHPDVVSWTALLLGYAKNGEGVTALDLFGRMITQGCTPNSFTFVAVLKACASLGSARACLERGKRIHAMIGCHPDIYVQNTLLDFYSKLKSMADAQQVFDNIKQPDVVSWSTLILGYAENGDCVTALEMFARMKAQNCAPCSFTFVAALKACSSLAVEHKARKLECLERGRRIHLEIGYPSDTFLQNTLIDMYAKCGSMDEARQVFEKVKHPDVVAWTAVILGYAENGEGITALDLFSRMKARGCAPNSVTFVAALKACSSLALDSSGRAECLEQGKQIHSMMIGCHLDSPVQSCLIDMYAKCGSMIDAQQVFDGIKNPDVVSWTALILGYADNGKAALDLVTRMRSQGCCPDTLTFVAVLKSCSLVGALEFGSRVHAEIDPTMEDSVMLVTSLVDFYAKCGKLVDARRVFDSHPRRRDLRTWTALLAGYSRSGDSSAVFELLEEMQDTGLRPDGVTCLCILTCCVHAGLVEKADEFFEKMHSKHGVAPTLEHYTCMVAILGHSNRLDDAVALLRSMRCVPDAVVWMTVLGACYRWKNMELGRLAFKCSVSLDDTNSATYVLLAHIYRSRGMRQEQEMVLGMRRRLNARKEPGQTCWTNEDGEVHAFP